MNKLKEELEESVRGLEADEYAYTQAVAAVGSAWERVVLSRCRVATLKKQVAKQDLTRGRKGH